MLGKHHILFLLCILLVACDQERREPSTTPTIIPTPEPGTLIVDPSAVLGAVSPYLLGSNYGPWIAVPVDMLPAAYNSQVKAIRFPGGAWGDRNDLKPYHVDPFMDFVDQVGAIPTISVRLREGTPQKAADLVHYTNVENQYGVKYWMIGNEPTLFAAELRAIGRANDYDIEQFNAEWREFALAMKEVDPDIKLLGPEIHQFTSDYDFNPKDSSGRDWMTEFLRANGDLVDVVTYHRYPFPKDPSYPDATIEDLRADTQEWDDTVVYLRGLIQEITGRDIPIALTEVSTHWNKAVGGEATPDSHYQAIWLAEVLGNLMGEDVFMFNHWMLTSSGGYGGWGMIGRGELRPSYYVYQLYSKFGSELIHTGSGVDDVSIYAAKRDDGVITLLLINLGDTAEDVSLQLAGETPEEMELWRLEQEHLPETASTVPYPAGGMLSLPPQSISLFVINR